MAVGTRACCRSPQAMRAMPGRQSARGRARSPFPHQPPPAAAARSVPLPFTSSLTCGPLPPRAPERGGNPELVRESQRRRYADVSLVDKVLELDAKWREGGCWLAVLLIAPTCLLLMRSQPGSSMVLVGWFAGRSCWLIMHGSLALSVSAHRTWLRAQVPLAVHAPLAARGQLDTLNMEFNKLNREIGALRKVRADVPYGSALF